MSDPSSVLRLEPEDLDGHTIDELTDYLEAGRQPADPSIDDSPACRLALAALQRLRDLAGEFLDAPPEERSERGWIDRVIAAIPADARPGRRFPLAVDDPRVTAVITEGAIRGLVRSVGDEIPGLLVGSVRIHLGEPATLSVGVALVYGAALPSATQAFRHVLRAALIGQVPFAIGRIDIDVIGLIELRPEGGSR